MLYTIYQISMVFVMMLLVPYLVGNGVCSVLCIKKTIAKNYVIGMFFIWAVFQLITVPLVLMKQSFILVVILASGMILGLASLGLYYNKFPRMDIKKLNLTEKIALLIMIICIMVLILLNIFTQHIDWDDSRFVVNAVDIVRTNRMFLTDIFTGEPLSTWKGELLKDVTSPWAVYIAYCAKMTGISVVIIAHTILPPILLISGVCVFWLLSEIFYRNDITERCIFVCLVVLINVFGNYSIYSVETFFLTRLWQGKAVVASIGIPAMFWLLLCFFERSKNKRYIILILFLNLSLCLMSGMGIVIGAVMLGCVGLTYAVLNRNWRILVIFLSLCIPNIIYYLTYNYIFWKGI